MVATISSYYRADTVVLCIGMTFVITVGLTLFAMQVWSVVLFGRVGRGSDVHVQNLMSTHSMQLTVGMVIDASSACASPLIAASLTWDLVDAARLVAETRSFVSAEQNAEFCP